MKKLSVKGLADFMTASPFRQRTILRGCKYPSEDEPRAKILYYRDARDRIAAYRAGGHGPRWLLDEARALRYLAVVRSGAAKTRLNHNARGLRAYARHFSGRAFDVLDDIVLRLQYGDVEITVRPDLHALERRQEKIVKLEFGVDEPSSEEIRIISQTMFEAAEVAGMGLSAASVLFLDVPRGLQHQGARLGSRRRSDIEASCQIIDAIWDSI